MRARAGYAEVIVCTLTWGSLGVVRRQIDLSSSVIVFFRVLFGALIVFAWLSARGRLHELRPRARPVLLVASGVIIAVHWVLEFEAYKRLDVASAILIIFLGPVLAALAAPFVLHERLRWTVGAALACALGGIALIAVPRIHHIDATGLAYALTSAVLFAILLLAGKLLTEHYGPATLVVWQLGIGAIVLSPALAGASAHQIARGLALVAMLGVAYTGIAGILFFRAMRALPAPRLSVLFYLEPASAVFYAWLFVGERPTVLMLAGGALVLAAGVAIIISDKATVAPTGLPEPLPAGGST